MADVGGPDLEIMAAELEVQIAQQQLNLKASALRRKQVQAELTKMDNNDSAANKHIELLTSKLQELKNNGR
jgi:hypothetical protein